MKKGTGKRTIITKNTRYLFCFAGPACIYMGIIAVYPILYNFYLMFRNMSTRNFMNHQFVGLDTIKELLDKGVIWTAAYNTVLFTVVCTVIQFVIGFAFAMLLSRKFCMAKLSKSLLLVSWLIPMTVTGILFKFIFQTDSGILNFILQQMGAVHSPVEWLTSEKTAIWCIIAANCWVGIPFDMVLLSTGLANIPENVLESASIDGAGRSQRFLHITLPMLRPTMYSILILGVIYTFKVFDLVQVMTGGGPVNATEMLSTYAYKLGFREFNFSQASVVANFMFILLFIVGVIYLRFVNDDEVIE